MSAISSHTASGSGRRPGPNSPQAISPSSGSSTLTPASRSRPILRCVASCCHIFTFIPGTASTGLSVARISVVPRSSAIPAAILASRSAVAGQTTTRSAWRESWIWPISASSFRSHRFEWTWLPDSAARLIDGDELRASVGQHASHVAAALLDQAHEFAALVGGNAAAHDKKYPWPCHRAWVSLREA